MTPAEELQGGWSGKVTPFCDSRGLITYKRRRRDGGDPGVTRNGVSEAEEHVTRSWQGDFPRNGTIEADKIERIATNWKNVLESLMQNKDVVGDDGAEFCVQKALACDPFGFSGQPYNGSVQTEESSRGNGVANGSVGARSTRQSLRSSGGKSELNLHGTNTLRDQQLGFNTSNCQNALCDIMTSEKFALLCDLLGENFKNNQAFRFDLSPVFSKIEKGIYEQSTDLFDQDMQLVWEKYLRIGQDMAVLSNSLLSISRQSYQRRVQMGRTTGSVPIAGDQNHVLNDRSNSTKLLSCCLANQQQSTKESVQDANNVDSNTTIVITSRESDPFTKAEQLDPSCLSKIIICYRCGLEADGSKSLICDGCEAAHHLSCIYPPVKEIPKRTWYCAACASSRGESAFPVLTCGQQNSPHKNCAVCERLDVSSPRANAGKNLDIITAPRSSRECSVSSMEDDESPEPSRTAVMRLCKQCGTCEDEEKRFLICSNKHCLYKYYHIRCLKSSQLASRHQPPDLWYCPSCLCRGCLVDKDDDLICLCDICDEGYHTYCMNPSRTSIPKGTFYCFRCNVERAKKGMKMYEQQVLQIHGKSSIKLVKQPGD